MIYKSELMQSKFLEILHGSSFCMLIELTINITVIYLGYESETEFLNDLQETLSYGELLKHRILPNSKNFWISMQCAIYHRHFLKLLE